MTMPPFDSHRRALLVTCFAACLLSATSPCLSKGDSGGESEGGDDHGDDDHGSSGGGGGSGGGAGSGSQGGPGSDSDRRGPGSDKPVSAEDRARDLVRTGMARPFAEVIPTVRRAAPGRILDVLLKPGRSGYIYDVTVLSADGRYIGVIVDAKANRMIELRKR